VPVKEIGKPGGKRCEHQRHGRGCAIYGKPERPPSCSLWSCRWLCQPEETAAMSRPDRAHYVVDLVPDFVVLNSAPPSNEKINIQVVQIWLDPKHPEAWREPALLAYLERQGKKGVAALMRLGEAEAFAVFPPSMAADGGWHEMYSAVTLAPHTLAEVVETLGGVAS
jgi:hypothetical protein